MTDAVALWLGERLLIGSLQGAVVIALVWLVCRLVPRMPAAAQAALWWLAALKLVLVFTPVPGLPVALLPATVSADAISRGTPEAVSSGTARAVPYGSSVRDFTPRDGRQPVRAIPSPRLLVLLWLAMVLVQAGRLLHAHRTLRRIVNRSASWPGDETSELAKRVGLTRPPQVRLSEEIDTPQVCGLREPVVLLPAETMATFSAEERGMVLCHELMHLRRRDLALGWIPACAERLFFFHPLARLAARRYLDARETACDAAAVHALGVPVADYARLLVRLGIGTARPAIAAGGSPFSTSSLKRRLTMLQHHEAPGNSRRWQCAIAAIATAVIPTQLVARTPPAAPPQRVELQNTQAQVEQPRQTEQAIERATADQQKAQEQAARNRAARTTAAQTSVEQARRLRERTQQAQQHRAAQDARVHDQQAEHHKRILESMALARENALRSETHHLEKQLSGRLELLEQMRRTNLITQHEILARQYRELAQHYERLAAEQRTLAEEAERAQREAAPAK